MLRIYKSLGHAVHGLTHALRTERNLQIFCVAYVAVLFLGAIVHLQLWDWVLILIVGAAFLSVELLNTALEHFVDAFDEYRHKIDRGQSMHLGLRNTKDIGSAASLISLLMVLTVICIVFWPYIVHP